MEPNPFHNPMYSDDIEGENIFLEHGDATTTTDLVDLPADFDEDGYPLSEEDMLDNDLQRLSSRDTDPRSIASSEAELAIIQPKPIESEEIESKEIPTRPPSPEAWSAAAPNRLSQTNFQGQDLSDLSAIPRRSYGDRDEDDSQLGDSSGSNFPILSNSSQSADSNGPGEVLPNRKRPRTATGTSLSANSGHSGLKSRKITPSPGENSGSSAVVLNSLPVRQLFAFSDDFEEIEREQREAENWLKQKREQERLDEEFARSLQQHWNEESYSSSSGSYPTHRGKPGNSSKFKENYIEIASDSELEEVYPQAGYAAASRSAPSSHNQCRTTSDVRGLWSKDNMVHETSSSCSTSHECDNSIIPRGHGFEYSTYSSNSMSPRNPNMFGAEPGASGSHSCHPDSFRDGIADLIYKTSSELETRGMSSSDFKSTIYEQITPNTTMDELKTLMENIRPDQELDCNRVGTPEALQFTLMEHQKLGLAWMKSMEECSNRGGILADDMGLGKTIQALALMVSRPSTDPERKTTLIVAPVALIQQWKREIERMLKPTHQLTVFILHNERGVKYNNLKKYDVVLTTYGTLASELKRLEVARRMRTENEHTYRNIDPDEKFSLPLLGERSTWYRVIIDEAQCIRNKATKAAQACYRLKSTYRWCMTGTPMMNNVSEIYSLIKFLRIGPYNVLEKFNYTFSVLQRVNIPPGFPPMKKFQALLKAILLRRTKSSEIDGKRILQLPPRTTEKTYATFSEDEESLYDALESKTQVRFNKYLREGTIGRNYSNILVLLLRLRQTCCHPHLIDDLSVETIAEAAKIDLIENAKRFEPDVVSRLKANEDMECPVCFDVAENAIIFFPCGHSTCAECFAIISDPSRLLAQGIDGEASIKCPHCRTLIDPKKITDNISFKKVFYPDDPSSADREDDSGPWLNDDGDGDIGKGKGKAVEKKSLSQLKKQAVRNAEAKKEYIRYLNDNWVTSAKIEKTMETLRSIQSRIPEGDDQPEKTIIFSQFTTLLDLLQVPIEREGWGYCRYDGSMQPSERNEAVLEFSDSKDRTIMLISLKAGNSGLNLTVASQVIILDPFWNPYIEEQAIDRAHRIGQLRPVMVHRIFVKGTVEDRILELQDRKRALVEGALDEKASQTIGRLNTRELAFLFGVTTQN
ncbi:SWI/SNF family DNA-dependent ATPase Ris1, variant [Blastomyces dermatitidis ER-3]|uniref:SWI/SNF family DNA-dependent ATPase Ris1 n=1 Tax=Ajellomyces dermatitidis (strain ER-3 / ATCC MYA-2586) TaxID=559297 RepID=A0ABP2EPR5_AJEDR|nr:SWI/SNF family DNA-dependent ATPase Ris1 [Blastomyces dermatitidis ER-3]XP_045282496.1 SWI/SNF family DNA-dependent ATPase Ris1, variant [Blastomyces dermatitidis ER-3]EEQ85034.1 SWI/SNF family DNA-dependent ATPase Ris1 [Blastomyces dermatitidis ER-3]OAT02769.1 SWI/SNF family DNA-dependent ATPase Ris1, variant [Blastomyces dermatitidis ER-3]